MSVVFSLLFAVYLDEQRIGEHRFTLAERGAERELVSEASFRVSVLGIPAYRYAHHATERWRGDCLASLVSRTNDGGERHAVDWRADGGCTLSFAYWNPRILGERALLNAQTGEMEPVHVEPLGEGRWRLAGPKVVLELQYDGERWIGLEAATQSGRRLRYRLERPS
jgi:hypothetical protein